MAHYLTGMFAFWVALRPFILQIKLNDRTLNFKDQLPVL